MDSRIEVTVRHAGHEGGARYLVDEVNAHRPIVDTTRDEDTAHTHRVADAIVVVAVKRPREDPAVNARIDRALRVFEFMLKDED